MSLSAVALVLLAALMHAAWNALVKSGDDRLLTLGLVNATRFFICLGVAPWLSLPEPASWPFLALSAVLHIGYYLFLVKAYEVGDLSHVYPLARGASPLLILIGALAFADERLGSTQALGVLLVSAGIMSLTLESLRRLLHDWRPSAYALVTAALIAAYSVTDGMGVRRAGQVASYVVWLTLLDGLPVLVFAMLRRRAALSTAGTRAIVRAAGGGLLQLLAYGLVLWAMTLAPIAGVSALRETSIIFAGLIGWLVLREPFGPWRAAATVAVATGVVVMQSG